MRTRIFLLALTLIGGLSSCSSMFFPRTRSYFMPFASDSTAQVILLTTGESKDEFEEMGTIAAWSFFAQEINQEMRSHAKSIGADAVIRVHYYYPPNGWTQCIGTAIRYKEPKPKK